MAKALAKGSRITGAQRTTLASQYAKRYAAGESIRKIADDAGRSFGFVHGVLKEAGVELRGRGGATRGAKKTASSSAAKKGTSGSGQEGPGEGSCEEVLREAGQGSGEEGAPPRRRRRRRRPPRPNAPPRRPRPRRRRRRRPPPRLPRLRPRRQPAKKAPTAKKTTAKKAPARKR